MTMPSYEKILEDEQLRCPKAVFLDQLKSGIPFTIDGKFIFDCSKIYRLDDEDSNGLVMDLTGLLDVNQKGIGLYADELDNLEFNKADSSWTVWSTEFPKLTFKFYKVEPLTYESLM